MPTPPLPEQPGRTPVPREAARSAFIAQCDGLLPAQRRIVGHAFDAGWDAALAVEPEEIRKTLDTTSLFPTMGLDHDT